MQRPLNRTLCSSRKFSSCSLDEKFISRETARHLSIFFGTRATWYKQLTSNKIVLLANQGDSSAYQWRKGVTKNCTSHLTQKQFSMRPNYLPDMQVCSQPTRTTLNRTKVWQATNLIEKETRTVDTFMCGARLRPKQKNIQMNLIYISEILDFKRFTTDLNLPKSSQNLLSKSRLLWTPSPVSSPRLSDI